LQGKSAVSNPHRPPLREAARKAAEMRLRARRTRSVLRCSALHKTEFQFSTERGRGLAKTQCNNPQQRTRNNNTQQQTQQHATTRGMAQRDKAPAAAR